MSKYRARKTEVDGILFDSKKEAERYKTLSALQEEEKISHLELQKKYIVLPSCKYEDMPSERAVTHKADFYYINNEGREVVEDVKGFKTKDYIIKRKLMKFFYPDILFREIQ